MGCLSHDVARNSLRDESALKRIIANSLLKVQFAGVETLLVWSGMEGKFK